MVWYFALNKMNYARYCSFYYNNLPNIKSCIQAQESHPSRTSIDQRGEQTINKNAKTAGGVKNFSIDLSEVLKWVLKVKTNVQNKFSKYC